MAENYAYKMETFEDRLERLKKGSPVESIGTLIGIIENHFNNEIERTVSESNPQSHLAFLGVHAAILSISKVYWNKSNKEGYKLFVTEFMDDDNCKFSEIADTIHDWRNNLAHQLLGKKGHEIGYDYGMESGYRREGEATIINPRLYVETYLRCFTEGKLWRYKAMFSEEQQEEIKRRIIKEFEKDRSQGYKTGEI